jgi:hypothetical protein
MQIITRLFPREVKWFLILEPKLNCFSQAATASRNI